MVLTIVLVFLERYTVTVAHVLLTPVILIHPVSKAHPQSIEDIFTQFLRTMKRGPQIPFSRNLGPLLRAFNFLRGRNRTTCTLFIENG